MKTLMIITFMLLSLSTFTFAQDTTNNAIGLRLGDNDGYGAEISYQRALKDNNRLELDLGIRHGSNYDGFKLAGIYQWVWLLEGNFNWFVGAGGGLGSYNFDNVANGLDDSETYLFAAGTIGIEYRFDIPLQLSLDARPEFGFSDYRDNLYFDIALSIRYKF